MMLLYIVQEQMESVDDSSTLEVSSNNVENVFEDMR